MAWHSTAPTEARSLTASDAETPLGPLRATLVDARGTPLTCESAIVQLATGWVRRRWRSDGLEGETLLGIATDSLEVFDAYYPRPESLAALAVFAWARATKHVAHVDLEVRLAPDEAPRRVGDQHGQFTSGSMIEQVGWLLSWVTGVDDGQAPSEAVVTSAAALALDETPRWGIGEAQRRGPLTPGTVLGLSMGWSWAKACDLPEARSAEAAYAADEYLLGVAAMHVSHCVPESVPWRWEGGDGEWPGPRLHA